MLLYLIFILLYVMFVAPPPLDHLRALVVFAETGNMVKAAKRLNISQPALSKQLTALENSLNTKLFNQVGKRRLLNTFAENLVKDLAPLFAPIPSVIEGVRLRSLDPNQGAIRISARREVLDRLGTRLKNSRKIIFIESSNERTIESVLNRESHIGITHQKIDSLEIIAKPLFAEKFQLIYSSQWPSLEQKRSWDFLIDKPALAYKEQDEILNSACLELFKNKSQKIRIHRITENYLSLFRMAEAGLGWAVVPQFLGLKSKHCRHYPLKLKSQSYNSVEIREFQMIYRRELNEDAWMKSFISDLRNCFIDS